jgi:hypothetical protein
MTESKQMAIAILPKVSALLSICGSGFIIYDILTSHFNIAHHWWKKEPSENDVSIRMSGTPRNRATKTRGRKTLTNSAYYRLMLAMSSSDFIVSIAWFCTTWPIPKDENSLDNPSEVLYGNIGTMQTCTAQAFFIQLGIVTPFYNGLLSLYYYLTICKEWKEKDFKRKVEYAGHFVAVGFGLGTAIAGLFMEIYNNSKVWCWIAPYPAGCGSDENPCERGINSKMLRWAFYYGPLWVMIFVVAFFMSLVYLYVKGLDTKMEDYTRSYREHARSASLKLGTLEKEGEEKSASRFSLQAIRGSFMGRSDSAKPSIVEVTDERTERRKKRSKTVAQQGVFYAGTFAFVWLFGTITRAMQLAGAKPPWAIIFLFAIFTPSQGFFNFLVYIRPRRIRYLQEKKKRNRHTRNDSRNSTSFSSEMIRVSGMSNFSTNTNDPLSNENSPRHLNLDDPFLRAKGDKQESGSDDAQVQLTMDDAISLDKDDECVDEYGACYHIALKEPSTNGGERKTEGNDEKSNGVTKNSEESSAVGIAVSDEEE